MGGWAIIFEGTTGDAIKVAVALDEGASDRGAAGTGHGRDDLRNTEAGEADVVGGGIAWGVDEFSSVKLSDRLCPLVESGGDQDKAAAGGEPVLEHGWVMTCSWCSCSKPEW